MDVQNLESKNYFLEKDYFTHFGLDDSLKQIFYQILIVEYDDPLSCLNLSLVSKNWQKISGEAKFGYSLFGENLLISIKTYFQFLQIENRSHQNMERLEYYLTGASQQGFLEALTVLTASKKIDLSFNDNQALKYASQSGHYACVKLLLNKGCDVHAENDFPLRCASSNGHTKTVKLLLKNNASIHAGSDCSLRMASRYGRTETIKVLLKNGADIHSDKDFSLILASEVGKTDSVAVLLNNGADVHTHDDCALRLASQYGQTATVKVLLHHGANVSAHDNYSLKWATRNSHSEVIDILSSHGASLKKKTKLWYQSKSIVYRIKKMAKRKRRSQSVSF